MGSRVVRKKYSANGIFLVVLLEIWIRFVSDVKTKAYTLCNTSAQMLSNNRREVS